jgi:hypothetical protein
MWSDQYDLHIEATGFNIAGADVVPHGELGESSGQLWFAVRDGRLVGAYGISRGVGVARVIRAAQIAIEADPAIEFERLVDPARDLRRMARAAIARNELAGASSERR